MEYRRFGHTGIRVSELCLGAMTFGRESDAAESAAVVDRFVDAGGNFIDTANAYATSEEIIGGILAERKGLRNKLVIATKFRLRTGEDTNDVGASRRHIRMSVESSLRNLKTDWIDLYQIHAWDARTPLTETLSTLDDLVHEGKVRYLGASNFAGWHVAKSLGLAALNRWEPFACLQMSYSLMERGIEREIIPVCLSEGLALIPYSPLGGGVLTGKYRRGEDAPGGTRGAENYPQRGLVTANVAKPTLETAVRTLTEIAQARGCTPANVALNWVLNRPAVTAPILGVRTVAQLEQNLGALGWSLDADELQRLDEVTAEPLGAPYESVQNIARFYDKE